VRGRGIDGLTLLAWALLFSASPPLAEGAQTTDTAPALDPGLAPVRTEPVSLTLEEALRKAEAYNPRYRQAIQALDFNRIDRSDAWLSLLPTPQVTALSTGMSWNLQTVAQNIFGEFEENPDRRMIQSSTSIQRFGASLFFDFRNVLSLREQSHRGMTREVTAMAERRILETEVTTAFLTVQERTDQLALEDAAVERAERALELTVRLYALARRDRLDVLSAEIDLADREAQREGARAELDAADLLLRQRMGTPDHETWTLVPIPFSEVDPDALEDEALVEEALRSSPRIRQATLQQESAQRGLASHRARWLPTVSVSMVTARQAFERDGGGAFFQPNPGGDWSRNIGFQINLPDIGQGFRIRNDMDRSRLELRQQAEGLREVQLEIEQEIRTLLREFRQATRTLELQERRADLAETRQALQLEAYGLGRGSFLELQNAQDQAAAAQRTALQTRYALERTRLGLERVLGRPLRN
jgi:outer membrane protein TolC